MTFIFIVLLLACLIWIISLKYASKISNFINKVIINPIKGLFDE